MGKLISKFTVDIYWRTWPAPSLLCLIGYERQTLLSIHVMRQITFFNANASDSQVFSSPHEWPVAKGKGDF
jgi:hypothetical protein